MKIVDVHDVVSAGAAPKSAVWLKAMQDVEAAVLATDWPHGSGTFTIYPESGKKRGEGNGVVPIKAPCMRELEARGWIVERLPDCFGEVLGPGDLDAILEDGEAIVGFEWETGNISSSHRAINKLLLTLMHGGIVGGILVVMSDKLKVFLTDRIGNIGELKPYFALWSRMPIDDGILRVIVVEHDAESFDVPRIPKSTAGRALG